MRGVSKIRPIKNSPLGLILIGTSEASDFEPLKAISDWLFNNPDVGWEKQMKEASQVSFVQRYYL